MWEHEGEVGKNLHGWDLYAWDSGMNGGLGEWGRVGMVQGGFRGVGRARREEGGFKVQVRMGGCGFSRSGGVGYVIDGSGNGVWTI